MRRLAIGLPALVCVLLGAATSTAAPDFTVKDSVVLTRADGTAVALSPLIRVRCGPWARDVATPAIHVIVYDTRAGSSWHLAAVVADVRRRKVVRFPHSFDWRKPSRAQISGGDGRNEFNSDQEESSGRVTFSRVRCGRRLDIRFRVDAVVGSEFFGGTSVAMHGSFSARG